MMALLGKVARLNLHKQNMMCFSRLSNSRKILELKERGIFQELLPLKSEDHLVHLIESKGPQTVYCGFDPSADSLQLGNLAALMGLLHCQRAGHNVIALIGGATARVGDPSGRESERPEMNLETLSENALGLHSELERILSQHAAHGQGEQWGEWRVLDNALWYSERSVVEWVCDAGRHLRLRDLLHKESVKQRMKSSVGMSLKEFLYPFFQAFDWLHLYQIYGCAIQIGGNDQQGNIDSGQTMIHRATGEKVFGLTVPLVTVNGKKIGKSDGSGETIWLNPNKTTPYTFYQWMLATRDDVVGQLLQRFTFLEEAELKEIMGNHQNVPEKRIAQKRLAEEATSIVHGALGLQVAKTATKVLFSRTNSVADLTTDELIFLVDNSNMAPVLLLDAETPMKKSTNESQTLLDVLVGAGLFPTIDEAATAFTKRGIYLNGSKVESPGAVVDWRQYMITSSDNAGLVLSIGKTNRWLLLKRIK